MEWVNAIILVALVVFVLYQKRQISTLEKDLISQKNKLALQADILASGKDILASQKDVLDSIKEYLEVRIPEQYGGWPKISEEGIELRQRREMAEEKSRVEKEVREKTRTIEWYQKEFSVGLDAIFELLRYVPLSVRESIIGKIPNSVIKKGIKRLSDRM